MRTHRSVGGVAERMEKITQFNSKQEIMARRRKARVDDEHREVAQEEGEESSAQPKLRLAPVEDDRRRARRRSGRVDGEEVRYEPRPFWQQVVKHVLIVVVFIVLHQLLDRLVLSRDVYERRAAQLAHLQRTVCPPGSPPGCKLPDSVFEKL